ncbi:hypothetical protein HZS55_03135 [Halosimplex rubrum]|uniref:Uncharacterized protein n=1 Tax=Halosimplex rubrum TaxID=869889 RepID=A0A7D5NYN2_9EURY|nr:hypothetical protein [Halosimplex rubrum]QLH76357.1 hypothetical protein HZS55_03135 [Halosimplex rubrum]
MVRSLTRRQRGGLYVFVGFALLLNPFVVGALDIGDPDSYTYEPKEITFHDNGTYDAPIGVDEIDPGVACLDTLPSRSCALERAVHANGGVTYDEYPRFVVRDVRYPYVHVWGAGFFETATEELANGSVEYGLEPVPKSRVLDSVAVSSDDASRGVRGALETGQYRTSDPLDDADELVAHDGSYYVVTEVASRTTTGERRDIVIGLQWVAGIGGGWLVLRGQRHRVAAGG